MTNISCIKEILKPICGKCSGKPYKHIWVTCYAWCDTYSIIMGIAVWRKCVLMWPQYYIYCAVLPTSFISWLLHIKVALQIYTSFQLSADTPLQPFTWVIINIYRLAVWPLCSVYFMHDVMQTMVCTWWTDLMAHLPWYMSYSITMPINGMDADKNTDSKWTAAAVGPPAN